MVGTKWLESALVEMLFSCCCRWFFPITRPAVHELVRKVTMAEHTATMRYLMNAFMFCFISNTIFKLLILAIRSFPQMPFSFFQLEKYFSPTRKVIFSAF